jgi:hypothetical protein
MGIILIHQYIERDGEGLDLPFPEVASNISLK